MSDHHEAGDVARREEPTVEATGPQMRRVRGSFHRAVDPRHRDAALAGSRTAGRYSPADTPTLYLSSSPEGVAAAMMAHADARTPDLEILRFDVDAGSIVDLRDHNALRAVGVDPADAAGD